MIHVIATIEVVHGKRDEFLAEFRKNVPLVKAETGCLEYGPAIDLQTDIAAQIPLRSDVVTVVEKWESLVALKAHVTAPHMLSFRARVKEMVVKTTVQVLEPV
jgi:quinol monooxygenase YgiN